MPTGAPTRHIRPLDGIRGIAVVMVVIVHLSGKYKWGTLGVDVFFALSGFLITGILLRELEGRGTIDKSRFYLRRALRLYPALIVCVLLTLVLAADTTVGDDVPHALLNAAAALTYTSNLVMEATGRQIGLLNHTWTLAVEEQFYLLWPLLLAWGPFRRNLLKILPVVIVLLMIGRALLADQRIETLLPIHADQLMLGALLAAVLLQPGGRAAVERVAKSMLVPIAAGVALIVLILAVPESEYPFFMRGGYTAAALITVVVIAHVVVAPQSLASRALSVAPLVLLGRLSYGIYLYHFPILRWAEDQTALGPTGYKLVGLALTAVVVAASWVFVERPALAYKDRLDERRRARDGDGPTAPTAATPATAPTTTTAMPAAAPPWARDKGGLPESVGPDGEPSDAPPARESRNRTIPN